MKRKLKKAAEGMEQQGNQGGQMEQMVGQVQQMLQQGAQPADVVAQLLQGQVPPEAIMQILVQVGVSQEEAQGTIQQVMQGSQQQAPQEQAPQGGGEEQQEAPMMKNGGGVPFGYHLMPDGSLMADRQMAFGGPTPEDFKAFGKLHKKAYGGNVEFDADSPQDYISNLSKALGQALTNNNRMALAMQRTENNVKQFDALPKAAAGTQVQGLPIDPSTNAPYTKEAFDALGGWNNPAFRNYGSQSNNSQNPNYHTGWNAYPEGSQGYREQRFNMSPAGQFFGAFDKRQGQPQVRGFGYAEGWSPEQIAAQFGNNPTAVQRNVKNRLFGRDIITERYEYDRSGNPVDSGKPAIAPELEVSKKPGNWNDPVGQGMPAGSVQFGQPSGNIPSYNVPAQDQTVPPLDENGRPIARTLLNSRSNLLNRMGSALTPRWSPNSIGASNGEPSIFDETGMPTNDYAPGVIESLRNQNQPPYQPISWDPGQENFDARQDFMANRPRQFAFGGEEVTWDVNVGQAAGGLFGMLSGANEGLERMQRFNQQRDLAQRSPDAVFAENAPMTEGFYDQWGNWIPNDRGPGVLAGNGTDQTVYQPIDKFAFAAFGLEVGTEVDLDDNQIEMLKSAGYSLKRK